MILKEASVGLTNGLSIGLTVALLCFAWQGSIRLSMVVGAAIALNTLVAACLGGIVPTAAQTVAAHLVVCPLAPFSPQSTTCAGSFCAGTCRFAATQVNDIGGGG